MRAVARGLFLEALPRCPEQCGGPGADMRELSDGMLRHRVRHGCDRDIPEGERSWYAIRCPRCDGAASHGTPCAVCTDGGMPGFMLMRRCPASKCSPDIAEAMGALSWVKDGILPEEGSLGGQSISFIEFRNLFEVERGEVAAEQRKEG